jgi:hypothetical protein
VVISALDEYILSIFRVSFCPEDGNNKKPHTKAHSIIIQKTTIHLKTSASLHSSLCLPTHFSRKVRKKLSLVL